MSNDELISKQAAIDALQKEINKGIPPFDDVMGSIRCGVRLARNIIEDLPSAQPELHYCRECKWSRCHIYSDIYGKSETYWRCLNWDGETDEEGYCHEWERRTNDLE